MQQNNESPIENLVEKMIKEMAAEKTSVDFTAKLMMRVQSLQSEKSISYQPLISKMGWMLIAVCIMALLGFVIVNADQTKSGLLNTEAMNHFLRNMLQDLNLMHSSTISIYAVLFSTVMLFVQISILLNRYQKRLRIN
ncbi:MAG: hypothetical protein KGL19_09490 [Bacteroidota bacterium]|nr:hypothetical protein [Bacteroidota bacterium]